LCYATGDGLVADNTWSDSGIRLTVPAVHAALLDSGQTGLSNKEDTRPRPMTPVLLPTNTFPRVNGHQLTYVGTLLANQYISLVDVSTSGTSNPCVVGSSHTAPSSGNDQATTTGPNQASAKSPMNCFKEAIAVTLFATTDQAPHLHLLTRLSATAILRQMQLHELHACQRAPQR